MSPIIGHEHILDMLMRTAREGNLAHSYLFTGIEGIGKKMVGIRFAGLLNCPSPSEDPQGTCKICRRIEALNHPDFQMLSPDRGSLRIEQVRQLQGFFNFPPYEGRWRISLIDDSHLLTRAAQNALLKTLEEAPVTRMVILVTSKPHLLLPTVRSRCRRIRFAPLPSEDVARLIAGKKKINRDRATILAALAGGSVSEAFRLDTKSFTELRSKVLNALSQAQTVGWCNLLALSATIAEDSESARETIRIISAWLRDLLYLKSMPGDSHVTNRDFISLLRPQADSIDAPQILGCYDECVRALELIESDTNVNRNLVTDVMLARVIRILSGRNATA